MGMLFFDISVSKWEKGKQKYYKSSPLLKTHLKPKIFNRFAEKLPKNAPCFPDNF
jgi:hypothetical protein